MQDFKLDVEKYPNNEYTYVDGPYIIKVKRMLSDNNNGYIILPLGHEYEKYHYDDIPVDVHGSLTFSGRDTSGLWMIGFDTAHYGDCVPSFFPQGHYWTHEEVLNECRYVVDQLRKITMAMKIIHFYRRQKGKQLKKKINYLRKYLDSISLIDVLGVILKFI